MKIEKINSKLSIQEIFSNFSEEEGSILLESQMSHDTLGKFSYCLVRPFMKLQVMDKQLYIDNEIHPTENPLKEVCTIFEKYTVNNGTKYDFIGGFAGHLSYDLNHLIYSFTESLAEKKLPDLEFYAYKQVIAYDQQTNELVLITLDEIPESEHLTLEFIESLGKIQVKIKNNTEPVKSVIKKDEYLKNIKKVQDYIKAGDVYQINFTQEFIASSIDYPFQTYKKLAVTNPAPFAAYLNLEMCQVISSSPELFYKLRNGKIYTQPMKGTVKRTGDKQQDAQMLDMLKHSKKDQAELLMIVDLERNDFSKICKPGSVKVENLFNIIPYATVYQQVADVHGVLKDNVSFYDIILALFPGGSITGAPKLRAMEIIEELELSQRKVYTGSIGYFGFDGSSEFNIAIRTITNTLQQSSYQVGGGITWDSDPISEYEESLTKGVALRKAIENDRN